MSKYNELWKWIVTNNKDDFKMSFEEIEKIIGFPIDHSFLTCKKELIDYGYKVAKISINDKFVLFEKQK